MIPKTSITLLKDLARGADSVRWAEFYCTYEEPMRGFLRTRFPSVEEDDAIQETMAALVTALPDYHATPDEHRHFRNYLMGILKHKAADLLKRQTRESETRMGLKYEPGQKREQAEEGAEENEWRFAAMEAAVEQLMANPSINPRTREIFRHVALQHEPAAEVAQLFGVSRNNVDQIKNRLVRRLSDMVAAMTDAV